MRICRAKPRAWSELPPEEQARLAPVLERFRADFRSFAEDLRRQAGPGATALSTQSVATLLEQAVQVPDQRHVHFVGNQPVLSFWGFRHEDGRHVDGLALRPPPVVSAAALPAAAGRRWPLWLLPLLLLFAALVLLWLLWGQGCEAELPPETDPGAPVEEAPEPARDVDRSPGSRLAVPAFPGADGAAVPAAAEAQVTELQQQNQDLQDEQLALERDLDRNERRIADALNGELALLDLQLQADRGRAGAGPDIAAKEARLRALERRKAELERAIAAALGS